MRNRFMRFMAGRYGTDNLNRFILAVAFVILLLSMFLGRGLLYYVALGLLIFAYFRMFSRNIAARSSENQRYLNGTERIRRLFRINRMRIEQRGSYRFYKCPGCGQQVRVPKGRGHIRITCPKCRTEFEKTT